MFIFLYVRVFIFSPVRLFTYYSIRIFISLSVHLFTYFCRFVFLSSDDCAWTSLSLPLHRNVGSFMREGRTFCSFSPLRMLFTPFGHYFVFFHQQLYEHQKYHIDIVLSSLLFISVRNLLTLTDSHPQYFHSVNRPPLHQLSFLRYFQTPYSLPANFEIMNDFFNTFCNLLECYLDGWLLTLHGCSK